MFKETHAFIKKYKPNVSTEEVAEEIGKPIEIEGIPQAQTLKPFYSNSSTPNLYSGNFGFGRFPFHSDLAHWFIPPRFLLLRCIVPAKNVYTFFIDAHEILSQLSELSINRALLRPRKPQEGRMSLLKFKQHSDSSVLYRWDSLFLERCNLEAEEIGSKFDKMEENKMYKKLYLINPGDMLIIGSHFMDVAQYLKRTKIE